MIETGLTVRRELETGAEVVTVRRPATIVAGRLNGAEIVRGRDGYLVWTDQMRLALRLAKAHGLRMRRLDHEAEVWIPLGLAPLLRAFGAKFKRRLSPEAKAKAAARLATMPRKGSPAQSDPPRKAARLRGRAMGPRPK